MLRFNYIFIFLSIYSFSQELRHNVYFETDKYDIITKEEVHLNTFISSLDSLSIETIIIYGYCDDRGTQDYNLLLSKNRANTIKQYLLDSEFSVNQIKIIDGKGEVPLENLEVVFLILW